MLSLIAMLGGLAITLAASELMARGLTRLGARLGLSEGLLGLLAALAADSPELSSAVIALTAGAGVVGVGVVVGSNLFNLAALVGLSAIVAHGIRVRRGPLLLDGGVGVLVLVAAAAMVAGFASPPVVGLTMLLVAGAYVVVLATPGRLFPEALDTSPDLPLARGGSWLPVALLPVAVAGVVGGSYVMVHAALAAAPAFHISDAVLGTIVLAALTSLPNLYVALHFARSDRGTALYAAAMNSNSINLLGGLVLPAMFVGAGLARSSLPYFGWLLALTLLAVVAPIRRQRLTRDAGIAVIAAYLLVSVLKVAGA